jgi:peptidoglycan/LPS O-acetylase OafA/YrhL
VYARRAGWPDFGSRDLVLDNVRATLLYVMNWRVLSVGDAAGDLVALWSLAIEEQFYFAWPLILTGLLALRQSTRRVMPILLVAIVAVTVWRMAVYRWWGWEAAYLRTDTRVDGLLLGALAATLFVRGLTPARLPRWTPWAVIAVWSALMLTVKADGAFAYHGGITLWILASAAMILYVVSDPQPLRSLPARAAEKVGKGSYAIYLWQVPVIRAVARWDHTDATVRRMATALVGIAVCTVLSWYLVERPAQRFRRRLERRRMVSGDDPPTADASIAPAG